MRTMIYKWIQTGIVLAVTLGYGMTAWGDRDRLQPTPMLATATFAGGCFWCMEEAFEGHAGIVSVRPGYTGGHVENPTYDQVSDGGTGHAEAIEVRYDPQKISYAQLLDIFWRNVDPVAQNRQFCDYGDQYRSAIFYHDEEQKKRAEDSKALLNKIRFDGKITTEIVKASTFYDAEEYHQDYHRKNPVRYKFYKFNCGRAARLKEVWSK